METIIMNGVTLVLTQETAKILRAQVDAIAQEREAEQRREREEQKAHWMLWHWYARRWAMYGNKFDFDGDYFSDMYKDEHGIRPRFSREEIFWILYDRENWIQHGRH